MPENIPGKRVAESSGGGRALTAVLIGVGALILVYLGLCFYVQASGRIMPNTTASQVALGGLTRAQAAQKLDQRLRVRLEDTAVTFAYDSAQERTTTISSALVSADADTAARDAWDAGREGGFLLQGWGLLKGLTGGYEVQVPFVFADEAGADALIEEAAARIEQPVEETSYTLTDTALILHKGEPGLTVNREWLKARILAAFADGEAHPAGDEPLPADATFFLTAQTTQPAEPDLEGLYEQLYVPVADARFDTEALEIVPHTVGVAFDVEGAKELYDHTGWGSDCEVPLILTQPEVTYEALTATLFRDVLGTASSNVGGTANRASNVSLAASFCDEYILLPGQIFSYNGVVGSRTAERGFLPAPVYVQGNTVDEIGGGICQVSSTIYLAALNSNLKIVERQNHSYAVGYVPDGMDATVYYGSLDFRFENDTDYPIRMEVTMKKRVLTVRLLGTKTDDITVKMESVRLTTTPYETIYKIDATVPAGSPVESVTPYTGRKVEAYRCLYDGNGSLISRTLENVSNYRKRDRVYLINPADAAGLGLDSVTGEPLPSSAVTAPAVTEPSSTEPIATEPAVTTAPSAEVSAAPTDSAAVTQPAATDAADPAGASADPVIEED